MKMQRVIRLICLLSLFAGLAVAGHTLAAETPAALDTSRALDEMPVLTGEQWQTMQQEAKMAFILGIGHVVTIENHVVRKHPELKRQDFVAKLDEGLRGMPMNSIIEQVDSYYRQNPDDRDLPVMRVIWRQIVKPKLTTGIADRPLVDQDRR